MRLVNLTPHPIVICDRDGAPQVTLPACPTPARCSTERVLVGTAEMEGLTVPLTKVRYGAVENLPEPESGTLYIVSAIAAAAAKSMGRTDVAIVDDTVRDAAGRIIGAKALSLLSSD